MRLAWNRLRLVEDWSPQEHALVDEIAARVRRRLAGQERLEHKKAAHHARTSTTAGDSHGHYAEWLAKKRAIDARAQALERKQAAQGVINHLLTNVGAELAYDEWRRSRAGQRQRWVAEGDAERTGERRSLSPGTSAAYAQDKLAPV